VKVDLKTLFVGIKSTKEETSTADNLCETSTLFDFDAIVVDPDATWPQKLRSLFGQELRIEVNGRDFGKLNSPVASKRNEARHLLQKGGMIVCLMRPVARASYTTGGPPWEQITNFVSSYDWIPVSDLDRWIIAGPGVRMKRIKSSPFDDYLGAKEIVWYAYVAERAYSSISFDIIATNDADLAVAAQLKVGAGSVYLLPWTTHEKIAEILLSCIGKAFKIRVERPPPEWMKDLRVPREEELMENLQGLRQQLETLTSKEKAVVGKLERCTSIKKLLYEQGDPLHDAVKDAFTELGFKVEREGDKDLVAINTKSRVIFEVTGSEGIIDIDKFRQLLEYVQTEEKETGSAPKSILVGNQQINVPPDKREPAFTERAIAQSKVFGTCLLPTIELYRAVVSFRKRELDPKRFWSALLSTVGIFSLDAASVS